HLAEKHHARVPGLLDRLLQLSPDQVPFDHSDTLRLLGVDEEPHFTRLRQELRALFFSSEYLDRDVPHPGARAFVEDCRGAGAIVVYLTGRDHGGMHAGTVASLIAHAFPLDQPDVHLLMKPDQATRDLEFKSSTCQQLRGYGELVAFFDNEPENVNSFKEAFPSCIAVLVTTKHSKNPPPPAPGVERVANFLRPAC
ncbi:MAG: hypothetical protein HY815_21015, partial [Candidatus Riflebacteria bacterium]|nr:hypothetical protein [Candidatus Riflebacteria bacterium]